MGTQQTLYVPSQELQAALLQLHKKASLAAPGKAGAGRAAGLMSRLGWLSLCVLMFLCMQPLRFLLKKNRNAHGMSKPSSSQSLTNATGHA